MKNRMKRIFLSLFIIVVAFATVKAQTEKGDWMVGGNLRLNTTRNNTEISFTPNAGAFIIHNLAIGGNFTLQYSKTGLNKYTSFGIGPFARYYFTNANVRPLLHGSFNYLSTKSKIGNSASSTNTGINYFLGGGAAIFISDQVSIDGILGYDHTKYKNYDGSGGFALNIGFQVYIHKDQADKVRNR